jgi:hypothetical protein
VQQILAAAVVQVEDGMKLLVEAVRVAVVLEEMADQD